MHGPGSCMMQQKSNFKMLKFNLNQIDERVVFGGMKTSLPEPMDSTIQLSNNRPHVYKDCHTRELCAELTVTRVYWRKQNAPKVGKILKYFWQT
jgi:hypothetical protein